MAAGKRLSEILSRSGEGAADLARVTGVPLTTITSWLNEQNRLSRSKPKHVEFVQRALAYLHAEDQEGYVWLGSFGSPEPSAKPIPSSVTKLLIDYLASNHVPDEERQKARKALEAVLGLP